MATEREQEILRMIAQNPMISQQEIADRCGITRSSVAVHISNLMKKGLIEGKGYILPRGPYAAVVGGATMDIGGVPSGPYVPRDSNPGGIVLSPGGVGRNIAHNLALLGAEVRFVSVFGDDANGAQLAESCRAAGVDTGLSPVIPGGATAVYLFITNHEGEMEAAVSDMDIYRHITPEFLARRMDAINRAVLCVADTNLPEDALHYLAEHCKVPLFVDPVSTTKAKKLRGVLHRLHTLKCNRAEAALLAGAGEDRQPQQNAEALLVAGIQQVVITLGPNGALCASKQEGMHTLPRIEGPVANATGAGDAFCAALAFGHMRGAGLVSATRLGLAIASLSVAAKTTINEQITAEKVLALAGETC